MAKKFQKNHQSSTKHNGNKLSTKNFFKVDPKRAMKAKKNQSKLLKYKNEMNHQAVMELNKNLDSIRKNQNSFEKIVKEQTEKPFINPMSINDKSMTMTSTTKDLNDAIDKLSNL
ncbi:uncharacterized protein LOC142644902 [Dermatophagoides pteronyssinus]|uniref:uncharacterized protein LOC142644902 n=1 Tax=Dermatophagoides pteronyssinus TaxID=6956 RepID=UPI003F66ED8D